MGFLDRQGVHIGADTNDGAAFAQVANHAGLGYAGLRLDAHRFQRICHQAGGALLLKT